MVSRNYPRISHTWQRYEAKYLITETQAVEVVRFCRDYLAPDPYSGTGDQYPVMSIYFDSEDRKLLRQTIEKFPHRFKLRLRAYCDCYQQGFGDSALLEIKRRIDAVVQKSRVSMSAEDIQDVLWQPSGMGVGQSGNGQPNNNEAEFFHLRSLLRAQPVLGVFYTRAAYEASSLDRVRVTLDRDLHFGLFSRSGSKSCDSWWRSDPGGVILEIKFTNTYPSWISNMIRSLEIMRRGVCKYVICARAAGMSRENGLSQVLV